MKAIPHRLVALAAVGLLALFSCRRGAPPSPPQYEPAENLLTLLAEFQRYRDADLYRFPYPHDLSGQNVFRATLVRLRNYETLYGERYGELIAYTRAQAYARLGDYATAGRFCKQAEAYGGDLAAKAREDSRALEAFGAATAVEPRGEALLDFLTALEERVKRCKGLIERFAAPPWHALAQCEWEQAEVQMAEFIWANRQVIRDGTRRALDLLEGIGERHRESKRFYAHTVRLGDWAFEIATEYATLFPPERAESAGGEFIWEEFERWLAKAKRHYLEVTQSFGADERSEASSKLMALEAFERRIRTLSR